MKVCKTFHFPAGAMCGLHILHDNNNFQKWEIRYADAGIEILDEYIEGGCADGFITVCKDVCEPLECANGNEPFEVCQSYETPKGYGICELADLHSNVDYINDSFKYSNEGIEVIREFVKSCEDDEIIVCQDVCDEVIFKIILK